MAYQLSDLVTAVRKRAKDLSFDSSLITDYLQAANNQVVTRHRWPFMEDQTVDSVGQGATEFDLDSDIDVVLSLVMSDLTGTKTFAPRYLPYPEFYERHDRFDTANAMSPSEYTFFGGTVVFSAPLNESYQVNMKYLKQPSLLVDDDDVPDVPERFKELLIRGALARVEEYRGNFDLGAAHERKAEELTEDMLSRLAVRQTMRLSRAKFGPSSREVWGQ